jgi:hypothetical protein
VTISRLCFEGGFVIPGRAKGASPESITPVRGVWIPDSPLRGDPE